MAVRMVKCKYCGVQFDRNSEPFVEVGGRRYAHKACAENKEAAIPQEEKDYQALEDYIKKLFKEDYLNAKTRKQIRDFRKEYNYTFSGMLKTLYWWYEIKGNSIDLAQGGIGIIPFIYEDALKYYYSIYMAQTANENKVISKPKVQEIEIGSPRALTTLPSRASPTGTESTLPVLLTVKPSLMVLLLERIATDTVSSSRF